MLLQVLL